MTYCVRYGYYEKSGRFVKGVQRKLTYTRMLKLIQVISANEKAGCDLHVRPELKENKII